MSGVRQVEFQKSTRGLVYGEPPVLRYRREPKEVEPLCCDLRNEKIFKTNTRKARNPRNTHGQFFYHLVFYDLKKKE
jgi:hypothetical protein